MRITPAAIPGVAVIDVDEIVDDRGSFARTFSIEEFAAAGLSTTVSQCSVSFNIRRGTLRGMHFQQAPFGEAKLVRCSRGRVFDVAVDARRGSATFASWQGWELDASGRRALYLPPGVAHGYLTLEDGSELTYQMSTPYEPTAAVGFRWDDPDVGIEWPFEPQLLSERDRLLPPLARCWYDDRG